MSKTVVREYGEDTSGDFSLFTAPQILSGCLGR